MTGTFLKGMLLALVLALPACAASPAHIALSLHNLRPIDPANGHYELWAETDDGPRSAGKFVVRADGAPLTLAGEAKLRWAAAAPARKIKALALTQELPGDADDVPSKQLCLRGELRDGQAALVPGVASAEVAQATGTFLLDNPVTVEDPTDWNGVWFAKYLNRRYKPGVMLYDAPEGWLWAGWVIYRGQALRTGKFRNGGDNDDWAGYSGRTGATPLIDPAGRPMPGEDFIANLPPGLPTGHNLPDLAGAQVLVTLEHATLAHEERWPSPVVIFAGRVPARSTRLASYPLENLSGRLPRVDAALQ